MSFKKNSIKYFLNTERGKFFVNFRSFDTKFVKNLNNFYFSTFFFQIWMPFGTEFVKLKRKCSEKNRKNLLFAAN